MLIRNPITPTIDFEKDGIQHGYLKLPHSYDGSAWGSMMIPITLMKRGDGPTALLTGGNHGDEYEGPIALFNLSNEIELSDITGRVIIVPAMNYPAFRAASRTSPIDGGNMNRIFPGNPRGSVTEKIADYFQRTLLPMADFVLDLHSGGKTLDFVPFCAAHVLPNAEQQSQCVAAMEAFNAPYSMLLREVDATGMYDSAAEEMGKIYVSTELGGGGSASAYTVSIAKRGIRNFLKHSEILAGDPEKSESISLHMPDDECYISCEAGGLLEFCCDLGERVEKGQLLARVHDFERTGRSPMNYFSLRDGILSARHYPGLIQIGDIVAVIGVET
ncbi:MAG: N(2)-acetyl-L-2,4-diaminobutanoate deacetylase DoeB [Sneathiella sp.]